MNDRTDEVNIKNRVDVDQVEENGNSKKAIAPKAGHDALFSMLYRFKE